MNLIPYLMKMLDNNDSLTPNDDNIEIHELIKNDENLIINKIIVPNRKEQLDDEPYILSKLFEDPRQYAFILLALRFKKLISANTTAWICRDTKYKKRIVVIILKLRANGYYKSNVTLSHLQIQKLAFYTFGVKISIDLIKHTSVNDLNINYIPSCSIDNI